MDLFLSIASTLTVFSQLAGSILTLIGLRNAPEGFEDESGFHALEGQPESEVDSIVCPGSDTAVPF